MILRAAITFLLITLSFHMASATPAACRGVNLQNYMFKGAPDDAPPEKIYNFVSIKNNILSSLNQKKDPTCLMNFYREAIDQAGTFWAKKLVQSGCTVDSKNNITGSCSKKSEAIKSTRFINSLDKELQSTIVNQVEQSEMDAIYANPETARVARSCSLASQNPALALKQTNCCGTKSDGGGMIRAVESELNWEWSVSSSSHAISYEQCLSKMKPRAARGGLGDCIKNAVVSALNEYRKQIGGLKEIGGKILSGIGYAILHPLKTLSAIEAAKQQLFNIVTHPNLLLQAGQKIYQMIKSYIDQRLNVVSCYNDYEKNQYYCKTGGQIVALLATPEAFGLALKALSGPAGFGAKMIGEILSKTPKGRSLIGTFNKAAGTAARGLRAVGNSRLANSKVVRGTGKVLKTVDSGRKALLYGIPLKAAKAFIRTKSFQSILHSKFVQESRLAASIRRAQTARAAAQAGSATQMSANLERIEPSNSRDVVLHPSAQKEVIDAEFTEVPNQAALPKPNANGSGASATLDSVHSSPKINTSLERIDPSSSAELPLISQQKALPAPAKQTLLTDQRIPDIDSLSSRQQQLVTDYSTVQITSPTQNRNFIEFKDSPNPKKEERLFFTADNSRLGELNNSTNNKLVANAITNKYLSDVNLRIQKILKDYPDLEIHTFTDYKSIDFGVRSKTGGKLPKDLSSKINKEMAQINSDYHNSIRDLEIVPRNFDTQFLFRSGIDFGREANAARAYQAAKSARSLPGENRPHNLDDALTLEGTERTLQVAQTQQQVLARRLDNTDLVSMDAQSGNLTFTAKGMDLIKKSKSPADLAEQIRLSTGKTVSEDTARILIDHKKKSDSFIGKTYSAERSSPVLNSKHGGINFDLVGAGAEGSYQSQLALARANNLDELITHQVTGEKAVTEVLNRRRAEIRIATEPVMKKYGVKYRFDESGDDMALVALNKPIPKKALDEIAQRLGKTVDPSKVRMSAVGGGVKTVQTRNVIGTHGEAIEKGLRRELNGLLPADVSDKLTLGVRMQSSAVGKGRVELLIGDAQRPLTAAERLKVNKAFERAVKKFNEDTGDGIKGNYQPKLIEPTLPDSGFTKPLEPPIQSQTYIDLDHAANQRRIVDITDDSFAPPTKTSLFRKIFPKKKKTLTQIGSEYSKSIDKVAPLIDFKNIGKKTAKPEYTSNGYWRQWINDNSIPDQGWKLHVSATPENAQKIAQAVIPKLRKMNVSHKIVDDLERYSLKEVSDTQSGKFITIYPKDDKQAKEIAEVIGQIMKKNKFSTTDFIAPPGEKNISLGVYGRYGRFTAGPLKDQNTGLDIPASYNMLLTPDGKLVPDMRGKSKPDFIPDL